MSYSDSDDGELIGSDDKAQMAYAGMPPRDPDETSGSVWQRLKSSGALLRVSWPGLVFSMLAIAIARFGSHQAKSNWPVHKQVLAIYAYRLVTEETVPFYWLFIFMFFCSCIMAAVECNVNLFVLIEWGGGGLCFEGVVFDWLCHNLCVVWCWDGQPNHTTPHTTH